MIEFIVLIILVIFFLLLLFLVAANALAFFVNIVLLILVVPQAIKDLKKREMGVFYILSTALTAAVFIFNSSFKWLFDFFSRAFIVPFVQAMFLMFAFAHVMALAYFYIGDIAKRIKSINR